MFMDVLFISTPITWSTTSATMDTTSSAIRIASGDTNDLFYFLQPALRVEALGSCAQWDPTQVARGITFAHFSSTSSRINYFPFVIYIRGADAINSAVANSVSTEMQERYTAEKNRGQTEDFAVRGALCPSYLAAVPKVRFNTYGKRDYLTALVKTASTFKVSPYYFSEGIDSSQPGSWDWMKSIIEIVAPFADMFMGPLGGEVTGLLKMAGGIVDGMIDGKGVDTKDVVAIGQRAMKPGGIVEKIASAPPKARPPPPRQSPAPKPPAPKPKPKYVRGRGKK